MFSFIELWKQSGLSQKTWCEQNNTSVATFQYWLRCYRRSAAPGEENRSADFVPLLIEDPLSGPWCELQLDGNRKLVFYQPVSSSFLQSLIQ